MQKKNVLFFSFPSAWISSSHYEGIDHKEDGNDGKIDNTEDDECDEGPPDGLPIAVAR